MKHGTTGSGSGTVHGISERLAPDEQRRAERLLDDLAALGPVPLRLVLTRQDWAAPGARGWYRWLLSEAAAGRSAGVALYRGAGWPAGDAAPAFAGDAADYRRFVIEVQAELGETCNWLELADPLGPVAWPDLSRPSRELLRDLLEELDGRACLGGLPLDAAWLGSVAEGLPTNLQALVFSHLPPVDDWARRLRQAVDALPDEAGHQLWLSADVTGFATAGPGRLADLLAACSAGAADAAHRVFLGRRPGEFAGVSDRDEYSLRSADGRPSPLARWLGPGGLDALRPRDRAPAMHLPRSDDAELIIGGAGFIGCNMTARLARDGRQVVVFDDLSRPGTEYNADWLLRSFPDRVTLLPADIRDFDAVRHAVARAARIFHFAAQVAVTTSLDHPHHDHEVNALGTLNVLEAARRRREPPPLLFTSTNKVYGGLPDIPLTRTGRGYEPEDEALRERGIDEQRPLSFCSPYGCSKGAADQYVLDYAHTFGVPAAVLRMSCIYGPRQFGNEDQGWVAHFVRQVLLGEPVTLYGDGFQVRDVLYIDDLVEAAMAVSGRARELAGEAFNVGGGPANVLSLQGLLHRLADLHGDLPPIHTEDWRPSDQRYYASDTGKLRRATGWAPRVGVDEGVGRLYAFLRDSLGNASIHSRSDTGQMAL